MVVLISDGAYSSKSKVGGWGVILLEGECRNEMSGWEPDSSNNRMELMAVIKGLSEYRLPQKIKIVCDSKYVIDGSCSWVHNWIKNDWLTSMGEPVKNRELWEKLLPLLQLHDIYWEHVRGHDGHVLNERADKLAVNARLEGALCSSPQSSQQPMG